MTVYYPSRLWKAATEARDALRRAGVPAHRVDRLPDGAVLPLDRKRALLFHHGELWVLALNLHFSSQDRAIAEVDERVKGGGSWAVFACDDQARADFGKHGSWLPPSAERDASFQKFLRALTPPPP